MLSDKIKVGDVHSPKRALMKAAGYTDAQIKKPLIGVVNSFNEIVPGHVHLNAISRAVKDGILASGGTPMEFNTIAVCDGIAMGHEGMKYSLCTRELIADCIECMALAHAFDALVFIPNCDKVVPGMLMAAARLNLPSIFISGGPMLSLPYYDKDPNKYLDLNNVFEAVGGVMTQAVTQDELNYIENNACPTCGSCSGMFTANSMNCLCEVLGIALPGNGTVPAVYSKRIHLAKSAGEQIMYLLENNIRAKDILTQDALYNALAVDMALGCSTNSALHLAAIAYEAGLEFDLQKINQISSMTPNLCKLAPAGA
ncbi:MAG: dihydroxy-acid dehydratase, partial [Eubacteriaceae bacterium]